MHLFASITSRTETVVSVVTSLVTNGLGNPCVGLGLNLRSKVAFPACFWQSLLPDWHDQGQTRSCIEIQTEFIRSSALRAKY